MFNPMFIWVTRSTPCNFRTAESVRAMGNSVLTLPVRYVEPVKQAPLKRRPDALAFTCAEAVRHHLFERQLAGLPVFTMGDSTAAAALRSGYYNARSAHGDENDLRKLIATTVPRPAYIIHYSPKEPACDLSGYLEMSGYDAERRIVYESREASTAELRGALAALPMLDAIIVHCPEDASRIAALVAEARWYGIVLCISRACAREFQSVPGLLVETAAEPTESELMTLLGMFRGQPAPLARFSGAYATAAIQAVLEHPLRRNLKVANDNGGRSPAAGVSYRNRTAPRKGPDDPPPAAA